MEILNSKSQLKLFGYNKLFNSFIKLYKKNSLPNVMLLSGPRGLGKSTFAYHFINYLLSQSEDYKYHAKNFEVNSNNSSFKLIQNNIHPNFFLLENDTNDENIKIDQVRQLLKFLNKSTYSKDIRVVFIDNVEYLNLNSTNALLKSLEEPSDDTFFFIIHNDASAIKDTIKSRCIRFKFHFDVLEKKNIFRKIVQNYQLDFDDNDLDNFLYFETPGNLIKYLVTFKDSNLNILKNDLPCILFLIDKYKTTKELDLLNLIKLLIENFYNELSLKDSNNINYYFLKKNKILYLINDTKNFNLDKKNLLIIIDRILKSEAR